MSDKQIFILYLIMFVLLNILPFVIFPFVATNWIRLMFVPLVVYGKT